MSLRLRPYPSYLDSGVAWLGAVPSHWEVLPQRALFREVIDRGHPDEPMLSVTISRGVIRQSDLLADSSKKDSSNLDRSSYKLVRPGDLTYNKMRAWQGAIGVSKHQGIVSPAYVVVRGRAEHDPKYYHFLMRTPAFAMEAERWSYGITSDQWSLRPEDFKRIYSARPPRGEQEAIGWFLSGMDQRFDRLIRAKRRLIALVAEQQQAAIAAVVTRGLDSAAPLRATGLEWPQVIPEHWRMLRLGRVLDLITGYPFESAGFSHDPQDIRLLRGVNVTPGAIRWDDTVRWPREAASRLEPFALRPGDVVLGMDRPVISSGVRVATITARDVPVLLLQRVARLRARAGLLQEYLPLLVGGKAFADYLAPIFTGISVPHISPDQIRSFYTPLPPEDEQHAIVDHLSRASAAAEVATSRIRREIELLREYRSRLIADVVTGKLDVRGVELPELGEATSEDLGPDEDDASEGEDAFEQDQGAGEE
jgi:type I restriction enzyme, S subunit